MTAPTVVVRAPGRVNLIGEHTDYDGGLVLPIALDRGVTLVAVPRADGVVRLHSDRFDGVASLPAGAEPEDVDLRWARLPAAVLVLLRERGVSPPGFEAGIAADLPPGAGLSSSAAVSVATALAALSLWRSDGSVHPEPLDIPGLCRDAEARAFGVRCGLMDPYTILHARAVAAVALDCRAGTHRDVPVPTGVAFVVADSGVRHGLAESAYGRRREACERAASELGVASLRDADPAGVERLPEPLRSRARHVVTENRRTAEAVEALAEGDVERLGRLMDASHESLRTDCEVSCPELDDLVARARGVPGVLGSRMTGGGFGGSTVTAVRPAAVPALLVALSDARPRVVVPSRGSTCYPPAFAR